jgi:hypothetical protein
MNVHCYTRRRALQGAAAAFVGVALFGPRIADADAIEQETDLAPARAATLTALVAALALGPAAGVDPVAYTTDFAAYYVTSEPDFRELADCALDHLEPLAAMEPSAGFAALKAMTFDPACRLDVADGLMLAGITFGREQRDGAGYFLATG